MADISKCANHEEVKCTLKETCYRFRAESSGDHQSYSNFDFYANSCNGYWEVSSRQDEREQSRIDEQERFKLE